MVGSCEHGNELPVLKMVEKDCRLVEKVCREIRVCELIPEGLVTNLSPSSITSNPDAYAICNPFSSTEV
jgi:hypothetical protein